MAPITLKVGKHRRDQPEDKEAIHGWETDSRALIVTVEQALLLLMLK